MREQVIDWPTKKYELINAYVDSTIWNRFRYRDDDIVIASWGKSGCTWLQQIVGQLVFAGADIPSLADVSPWMEFAFPPQSHTLALVEGQKHRRFIKTHLPVEALVYSPRAKYLYIARDGIDVAWSLFNHYSRLTDSWFRIMREVRGRFGPLPAERPHDFRAFFAEWLERDGYPFWPFWPHVRSWWEIRRLPNVMLLHFSYLRSDFEKAIRAVAAFLEIHVPEKSWPSVVRHCSFAYMKENAHKFVEDGERMFEGGPQAFFQRGGQDGWHGHLEEEDLRRYREAEALYLAPSCATWLSTGAL